MLGLFLTLFTQQFIYQTDYTPQVKERTAKELVIEEPAPIEVVLPPREEYNINCYCVTFARQYIPDLPKGNADSFKPNTFPVFGGAVLFDYEGVSHIAVISSLEANGFWVTEANYKHCTRTVRLVKYNDPAIKGFYEPDITN